MRMKAVPRDCCDITGIEVEERRAEAVGRARAMTVTRRSVFMVRATSLLKNCS